ncbi:MAG: hypothetical protein ACJ73S_01695 [Mycobacteriales bacterium]
MPLLRRRRAEPAEFWSWFDDNAERLALQGDPNHRSFRELGRKLKEVHPALAFEVHGNVGGTRELVLSADGAVEGFPAVRALAACAPVQESWTVTAFRQPRSPGVARYGGVKLVSTDVWVDLRPAGADSRVDLTVYLPDHRPDELHVRALGRLVIETVLGEVLAATRLGELAWASVPDDPRAAGLTSLDALPALLVQMT